MIDGYRIVPFIPSGRRLTQEILLNHLRRFGSAIDQVQIWLNTEPDQIDDRAWLLSLPTVYGDWVRLIERPATYIHPKQLNTGSFYRYTVDPDTIYFRFDDDIVYVHDDYFKNMVNFRIENPEFFLVFGHIWHNAITSFWNQHVHGTVGNEGGFVGSEFCMDPVGWESAAFASYIHRLLLGHIEAGTVPSLFWDRHVLPFGKQFSVSNFCFFGRDFAEFGGDLRGCEEEGWLTRTRPVELERPNVVCGSGLVSHFSFFPHRAHLLEQPDILPRYREIAKRLLEARYYQLLGDQ